MRRFVARLTKTFRRQAAERELEREIAAHLAHLAEQFEREGLSPEEARLRARRTYGGVEQAKELHREARSFLWLEHVGKDVRHGARTLRRAPGFTAVAVIALALGIGANTAIFSVTNAVLLKPLPYPAAGELVTLLHGGTGPVATANYFDWRDQSRAFAAMGAADYWSANLTGSDTSDTNPAEHLVAAKVTESVLRLVGVQPRMGRLFLPGEDQDGADHEVILSYRLWQRDFNGDPQVVGKAIRLNGEAYAVVGVMPAGYQFPPFWADKAALWVPDALGSAMHNRGDNHLRVFARLKPGVTIKQAQADVAAVTARLEKQYPASNRNVVVTPLKQNVVGKIETPLLMLLGVVGFVLLIACANVGHMLLARTADRQKEIAVRTAIGAGRGRVMAQLLTENLLLAGMGAAAGLLICVAGTKALMALSPSYIPRVQSVAIDAHVGLFLLVITVGTAIAFGLIPALHATGGNLSEALKEGGRGDSGGPGSSRWRGVLVASEFALAFMLLLGAGLMMRSFAALEAVDPGFNPENVVTMVVSVAGTKEAEAGRRAQFYRELLEKTRALPGVKEAGAINHLPLAGDQWTRSFEIEGRPEARPGEAPNAVYRIVMPGYFETMELPLRRGRSVTEQDTGNAPPVVVLNERAARVYWPGQDPLGKRIRMEDAWGRQKWLTVVGICTNARQENWAEPTYPEMYIAALQAPEFLGEAQGGIAPHMTYITLVVRSEGSAPDLISSVKQTIWSIDRNLPISDVATLRGVVGAATAQPRFETVLFGAFAAIALVLAGTGIYGVMNYAVSRRTREIGIRISLGARRADVLWMVTSRSMRQALAGGVAGVAGGLVLARLMTRMLYGVKPTDPVTYIGVAVVLAAAAAAASCIPASRAARIDPAIALREE